VNTCGARHTITPSRIPWHPPAGQPEYIQHHAELPLAFVDMSRTRFRQWKWDLCIVFLCSAAYMAFAVFTVICVFSSPDVQEKLEPGTLEKINDYISGITLTLLFGGLGGLLLMVNRETKQVGGEAG
jgi:hypothetical protein